jgi:translation initiation factor IF-3
MDFGKYIYRMQKLEQKQKNKNPKNEIKGIRLGIATSLHDLEIKANQAQKFLSKGAKVKITLMFHGREISRKELGRAKINEFVKFLEGQCTIEQDIMSQGKMMSMLLKPAIVPKA